MEILKAAAVTMQLECADAAGVNMQMQIQTSSLKKEGGKGRVGIKIFSVL